MLANPDHITIIARGALLEMSRRKDLAILGMFMGIFLLLIAISRVVGLENPATGTFLLNLSLTLIVGLSHLVTLTMAARQLPDELERRTLYPLMARPIRRADILTGKWSACLLTGLLTFVTLTLLAILLVPRMEPYAFGTLLQLILLQVPALALTAALGIAFSIFFPRLLGLFLAATLVFGAGQLLRFSGSLPLLHLLPDPGRLNLVLRYTDGIAPLGLADFLIAFVYASLWAGVLLTAACQRFERRSI